MKNPSSIISNNQPAQDEDINKQRAAWAAIIFTFVALTSVVFAVFLIGSKPIWQVYAIAGITVIALVTDITGMVLIWRRQTALGLKYFYWSLIFTIPPNALLVTNTTIYLIPIVLLVGFVHVFYLQPHTWRRSYLLGPIIASIFMALVEILQPSFRVNLTTSISTSGYFGPVMLAFLVASLFFLIVRLAWSGNIRVKLVTSFIMVTLVAIGVVGIAWYINLQRQIRAGINQRLANITSVVATQQDGDLHATIQTPEDTTKDAYQKMTGQWNKIIAAVPDIAYIYTMRKNEQGQIYFVVDAEGEGNESVPVGEIYKKPSTLLLENFDTLDHTIVEKDFYTDEYGTYLSAYAPIYRVDGTREAIVGVDIFADKVVAQEQTALGQEKTAQTQLMVSAIAAILLVAVIGLYLGTVLTKPIINLLSTVQKTTGGDLSARAKIETSDEVGTLAKAFNTMTSSLQETLQGLEARVAERTRNLELAAEVGRSVSQTRALDVMLQDAAELIRSSFDLYYVQVYLTNPNQTALVLQSGTGIVGVELVGRGHSLPLNTRSINGRAAVEKKSIVIPNTAYDTTFKPNPLLPSTRSEMAVPLIVDNRTVGVLDMQSEQPGSLSQDTLPAFETLAGQLAIAVQNANFLAETEQARAEVESQARRLTRANWVDYLDAIHIPEEVGFVFQQNKVTSLTDAQESQTAENSGALVAPITVTGETLGNLVVEMGSQSLIARTDELLNTVARQVSQQIENLRLLDSAERYRAEAELASRRLTREGWQAYASNADRNMSYVYDLKEVRARKNNGDEKAEDTGYTLPLKVRDETIGKLIVQGLHGDDDEAVNLVNTVAERLGAHIESLRLSDQTQAALVQSEKLFDASRGLSQAANLQELIKTTVETLNIPVVNRAGLELFSYNAAGELTGMTLAANWWNGTGHKEDEVGHYVTADVVKMVSLFLSPMPMFFNDTFHDERIDPAALQMVKAQNYRAFATLPLFQGTRQLGLIILTAEEPHNFTQEEIRLFSSLAPQIATVLENRRQYERAQQQAERETTLNVISQKIQSATSVDAVLEIAARELGQALGATRVSANIQSSQADGNDNKNQLSKDSVRQ